MPEEELRSALRALAEPVVPPPGSREAILADTARRRRNRQWGIPLVAAAATVAVIIPIAWAVSSSEDHDVDPISPTFKPTITEPFDAPPCPDTLPDLDRAATQVPDLTNAVSIRLCRDVQDLVGLRVPPTDAELAAAPGLEALVRDLDEFAAQVLAIPTADPDRCATVDVAFNRDSLVIRYADRTAIVPVTGCRDLNMGGRIIDGAGLRYAFIDALDRQRDRFAYTLEVQAAPTCRLFFAGGPIKPGREELVRAIRCDPVGLDMSAMELSEQGLSRLQDSWRQARPHSQPGPANTEDDCADLENRPSEIIARTDRGDLVRFFESPCGYLLFDGPRPSELLEIPIEFDELS